jgi:hypothetical protein
VITVAAAAIHLEGNQPAPSGLALWGLGIVLAGARLGGLLHPRRAVYGLGQALSRWCDGDDASWR